MTFPPKLVFTNDEMDSWNFDVYGTYAPSQNQHETVGDLIIQRARLRFFFLYNVLHLLVVLCELAAHKSWLSRKYTPPIRIGTFQDKLKMYINIHTQRATEKHNTWNSVEINQNDCWTRLNLENGVSLQNPRIEIISR